MPSSLCIFDLASGTVSEVLTTQQLLEAPNWTPDGSALVVNMDGLLFRVDLSNRNMVQIDTGFAQNCNNDHGISPDGEMLVITDRTKDDSCKIYSLPIAGGSPELITDLSPSYWHGWSPDGAKHAYVGKRDGVFDIYTIGVNGGAETRLTHGFEHTDGPDYSVDGRWIWFNGQKNGEMQLWRMQTDGSQLEQITQEASWNWFPHPSPDGKNVLYLAYQPGTVGHPADKDVELRLLPIEGGKSRHLVSLFGGQGTINVPCWAPEGDKFAFVQYTRDTS